MTKLNTILFILILSQIGTVFAKDNKHALTQELIQHEAILEIQDLLCIDDCEQETMIAQTVSINKALSNEK
jgi:hypothetical protein